MAGSKVQSNKYFPNQRKGRDFSLVSQGDGGLSEMQRQANRTSDSIKLMMKREEVRAEQQIADTKTTHQNVLQNRQLLDKLEDQKFNTQIKAIKTNQRRENDNFQTLIEEARDKEEYWRWFTHTGAKEWAETAENLREAWDIYKGKQEIKKAQQENRYNDQVSIAGQADRNVESEVVKVSTQAQGAGEKQLTSWLLNGRVFKTNYAKRWQANQLLEQKEVLFGKIADLREQRGVSNNPQDIIEFYDFAATKTLRDIGLSGFTPEGKNLRQAIVGEGSAIAGHIASSNRHAQQQQAYNLAFADLKTALTEPYHGPWKNKQIALENKFNLAIVGYRNIQEIPGGGRQWIPNSANRQQAGVYILSQLAKHDKFISLGEKTGKAELIDFVQGLSILDEKTGLPTKENWWDKWANNPNTVQNVVLDSFYKASKAATDAEEEKHQIEDKALKLELQNDTINGQKINLQSKDGLQQLSNILDLASKKNYTKTTAYIKSRFPFLEDAKNGKIKWDTYVSIAGAWEERDLAQMSTIIQALDTPELQRKYHNKYLSKAWAISKGNLSVTEFPDYGYEIVGQTANGVFDRQKLTPHLHRTATRISDYAQALYFKKAGLLKENGSVKIGNVTVENAEDLKDEVKLTVQKEVAEGKNNPYSIWYHTDASGKLESGFAGVSNLISGGSLSTEFHFDKQFGRTTEGELSEDLSLEKVKIAVPGTLDNLNQLDKLLTQVNVKDDAVRNAAVQSLTSLTKPTDDNYANNLLDANATSKIVESLSQGKDIIDIPNSLGQFVKNLPAKKTGHKWTVPEVLNHVFEQRGIKLSFPPALETQLLNSGYNGSIVPDNKDDVYALLLTSRYQNYGATDKLNPLPTTAAVQLYSRNQLNEYRSSAPFEEIARTAGSILLCNPSDGSCIPIVPQLPKE